MRRIQFIEIHEQPWCPSFVRDGLTDALQFGFNLLKIYAPIAPLLQSALDSTGNRSIVDMGSGGGGPWLDLSRRLHGNPPPLHIWLTDKYPNVGAFQKIEAFQNIKTASENHIAFYPDSVDAMNVPLELNGLRTMFTSFHHFPPEDGRAILQNAVDARDSIGIFEVPRRSWSTIGLTFGLVLLLFVCTLGIRPFRWSRLFWTYLIPIIPLVLLFDGVVSCLRTYRPQELREIVTKLTANDYQWETGEYSKSASASPITYLIGYPRG
jgi:hypothetical protein